MTCPHCSHFHKTVYPDLKKKYIDTARSASSSGVPARPAGGGRLDAGALRGKDKYFPLVEAFFDSQSDWVVQKPLAAMFAIAKQAGFTQQTFDECLANQQMPQRHRGIADPGGVPSSTSNSTPTFFINGKIYREP